MPAPAASVLKNTETSSSGSPKKVSAPTAAKATSSRRMTPAVAAESPPMPFSSGLPSSLVR